MNYSNPEYDKLFREMESMENSTERQAIIDKMLRIVQHDAPAVWQFYPVSYILCHQWLKNIKPNAMCYNVIKYQRIEPELRVKCQKEWNKPVYWPIMVLAVIVVMGFVPVIIRNSR